MKSNCFKFKQFVIQQALSAMKVGTDGVLLGAWVELRGDEREILDIGTGTGLIALMVAQRSSDDTQIYAVEIEAEAASEAMSNADMSPWSDRVMVENIDLQTFAAACEHKFDVVVSNPPYFNGTYKSKIVARTAARHSGLLNSDDLISGVVRLLNPENGRFSAIFPFENAAIFVAKAAGAGLFCNRIMEIYSKPSSGIKRVMAEFSFAKKPLTTQKLVIADYSGEYTPEFRALTNDFYLKF